MWCGSLSSCCRNVSWFRDRVGSVHIAGSPVWRVPHKTYCQLISGSRGRNKVVSICTAYVSPSFPGIRKALTILTREGFYYLSYTISVSHQSFDYQVSLGVFKCLLVSTSRNALSCSLKIYLRSYFKRLAISAHGM